MNVEYEHEFRSLSFLAEDYIAGSYRRERPPSDDRSIPIDRDSQRAQLEEEVRNCRLCPLCEGRRNAVPGVGVLDPLVMVIGEGPGAEEDRLGEPFVGPAGRYLDDWLAAIQLSRQSNVYITNVVKCRPPGNRDPEPDESAACRPFLERQIELIRPRAILAAGRVAAQQLTASELGIGKLRNREHQCFGLPLVATYHPSAVLRNPDWRRPVWEDLKLLRSIIDR